jgi:hypothetical protein
MQADAQTLCTTRQIALIGLDRQGLQALDPVGIRLAFPLHYMQWYREFGLAQQAVRKHGAGVGRSEAG